MWTRREAAAGPSPSPPGAAPAPPASEALRPAASGPPGERGESGVLGGWGSWVPPSPSLRGEGTRPWGPGRASAEERDLEGVYTRGPFPKLHPLQLAAAGAPAPPAEGKLFPIALSSVLKRGSPALRHL